MYDPNYYGNDIPPSRDRKVVVGIVLMCATITAAVLFFTGCKQKVDVPPGPHEVSFKWHILPPAELRAMYLHNGMELPEDDHLDGFVGIDANGDWVVYTTMPRRLDDRAVCTLGHEVLHIVAGDYHR